MRNRQSTLPRIPRWISVRKSGRILLVLIACALVHRPNLLAQLNDAAPKNTVRLLFIHHSVGENWLSPDQGGLLEALNRNNYYVYDTNYDWGPLDEDVNDGSNIGSHTDMGHWYNWFLGPHRNTYTDALFKNDILTEWYLNDPALTAPGGENNIILFKSCFISTETITGSISDPPLQKGVANPLHGVGVDMDGSVYTVSNIKGLYRDLLDYFSTRPDKLFILITSPPVVQGEADEAMPLLRAINTWLVQGWLATYPHKNVAVFDFSRVLTSNGGNPETADVEATTGSHHRFRNGAIEYIQNSSPFLAYGTYDPSTNSWDNHPTPAGSRKATAEFLPLLNIAYNAWHGATGINPVPDDHTTISCRVYPLPATNHVCFEYQHDRQETASLDIIDVHGRVLSRQVYSGPSPGSHTFHWSTNHCADGVYMYRLQFGSVVRTGRLIVHR